MSSMQSRSLRYLIRMAVVAAILSLSSAQKEACSSLTIGSNFYKINVVRRLYNTVPDWVQFHQGSPHYCLNSKVFKMADRHQDDAVVQNVSAPIYITASDQDGNLVYQHNAKPYVRMENSRRTYEINVDGKQNLYKFLMDHLTNVVYILSSPFSNLTGSFNGKLYWISIKQFNSTGNILNATPLSELDGELSSMDVDNSSGDILVGGVKDNIGIIYLLQRLPAEPCAEEERIDTIAALESIKNWTNTQYAHAVLNRGKIQCQQMANLTQQSISKCLKVDKFSERLNSETRRIIGAIAREREGVTSNEREAEALSVKMTDAANKLHIITKSAVLNNPKSKLGLETLVTALDLDQLESYKYSCITNEELKRKENDLDIATQLAMLKEGLMLIEERLRMVDNV